MRMAPSIQKSDKLNKRHIWNIFLDETNISDLRIEAIWTEGFSF